MALLYIAAALSVRAASPAVAAGPERPNILWITAEDMSPHLGCYGDAFAYTPNLDAFAQQAVRYTSAFATAPVCSPARACLITGVYATSLGNPHLRCEMPIPQPIRGFPAYLRAAGYFTTNNVKTDYNLRDEEAFKRDCWDRSSADAHWRQRQAGQPFFAVFNLMETHQSRTSVWSWEEFEREIGSRLASAQRADPARVPLPPYYPDTPLARRSMARYYDCIAAMDQQVGRILRELDEDGLADDTIVFFYSDHGMGMPRGKRCLFDSGLRVPLMVRFPAKWRQFAPGEPGQSIDRPVSFVDFAPTVLSLAGVSIPAYMQGSAFLEKSVAGPRKMVFGARDRVDEAFDTARSVRDGRWLYIRNYRPDLSWAQPEGYSDQSDFRRELEKLARQKELAAEPMTYLAKKRPREELYDTQADPHQLVNLVQQKEHASVLSEMRGRLRDWLLSSHDLGFLPEADMLARCGELSPYEMARLPGKYPLKRILDAAELVGREDVETISRQRAFLSDGDSGVRYWAALGLRAAGRAGLLAAEDLRKALSDSSSAVRVEAAWALVLLNDQDREAAVKVLASELGSADWNHSLHAARALQLLGSLAEAAFPVMQKRLVEVRQQEGQQTHALFVRFALEAALQPDP